jgi:hypothetical protein
MSNFLSHPVWRETRNVSHPVAVGSTAFRVLQATKLYTMDLSPGLVSFIVNHHVLGPERRPS